MSDRDFEIGAMKFKLNKIDTFKQFHIARRVGPILGDMLPIVGPILKTAGNKDLSESQKFDEMAKLAKPLMDGFAKLSEEDSNKILLGLLSAVEIQQATGNWAKVATENQILFQDLELPTLLMIAGRAFAYNLSGFFAGVPRK